MGHSPSLSFSFLSKFNIVENIFFLQNVFKFWSPLTSLIAVTEVITVCWTVVNNLFTRMPASSLFIYQSMVSSPWLQWPCETLWRVRSLFCWTFSSPCPFFPEKMPIILINFKAHDDVLPSPPRLRREFILWDLASLLSHWSLYLLWSWTNAYDRRVSLVSYSSFTAP